MTRLAAIVLLCAACAPIDRGLIEQGGHDVHADEFPVRVECKLPSCAEVDAAIRWWNEQTGLDVFERTTGDDYAIAVVEEDDIEWPQLGVTRLEYSRADGAIMRAEVRLHRRWWDRAVLRHEMGHCVGLDDDPNSVDLRSVMSMRRVNDYRVTPYDRATIRRIWREAHEPR